MSGDIRVSGECGTKKENRPPQISGEQPLEAHATNDLLDKASRIVGSTPTTRLYINKVLTCSKKYAILYITR